MNKTCSLCGRDTAITFHHLIPKSCHRNKWFKKTFAKNDMQERGIDICRRCHSFVHKQFSEKFLGRELNTREKLVAHPTIQAYMRWAKKH